MTALSGEKQLSGTPERVWALLTDATQLAMALPGAGDVVPAEDGESYRTTFSFAVGPVKGTYEGTLRYEDSEPPAACTIVVDTAGRAGHLSGRGNMRLEPTEGGGTLVRYTGDFRVSGAVANAGQRLIGGVARKMIEQTLESIDGSLNTPPLEESAQPSPEPLTPRRSAFWHPFANMAQIATGEPFVISRARGSEIFDANGRRYLDATASLWYCNVGYGREEIVAAIEEQLGELPAYSTFGAYTNAPAEELADRIASLSPFANGKVFLTSGGSDAIDTAAKLARRYWSALGRPEKRLIVSRRHAYHGMHAFGTSLAGIPANMEGLGTLVPDVAHVEALDPEALAAAIDDAGADRVAAFIGEPVIGAGGVLPPPDGYWRRIAEICAANDVLLIADEVITGYGRLGRWFACQYFDFTPDLIVFAKGVTSGYMPLGGVVVSERVAAPFWKGDGIFFRHGYTYSGHAAACAAGIANLRILEGERLLERVTTLSKTFAQKVEVLAAHPLVSEVRTSGLLGGVELRPDAISADPALLERAVQAARKNGVLTRSLRGCALHLSPAFTIEPTEIEEIVGGLQAALDDVRTP